MLDHTACSKTKVAPLLFGDAYQFKVIGDLVLPIIVGVVIGYPYAKNRDKQD